MLIVPAFGLSVAEFVVLFWLGLGWVDPNPIHFANDIARPGLEGEPGVRLG